MSNEIDIGQITEVLNYKADIDLTNTLTNLSSASGKYYSKIGLPNDAGNYVDLTLPAATESFTVPGNGWIVFRARNVSNGYIEIGGILNFRTPGAISGDMAFFFPVNKNFTYTVHYTGLTTVELFRFIYAEGELV